MSSPRFVSPGAMAGNAIEQFLMQRELQNMERQKQAFLHQQQVEQSRRQAEALQLQQQQEARIAAAQTEAQQNLETERGFRRAGTIASTALPGDAVDDQTAGLLREHGFGGQIRQTPPTQGAHLGVDESGVDQYDVIPGITEMRGGSQYLNAQAQREAAAANAEANRVAAGERASEANATREEIARLASAGANSSRALQNELTGLRIDSERTKQETAAKEKKTAAAGVASARQRIRSMAQALIDNPALDSITGAIEGRRDTFLQGQNAQVLSDLNQLIASLSVEERGKLKGQGAVSNFEAEMLTKAVSAINRAAGPENVRKELREILAQFQGDTPMDAASTNDSDALLDELLGGGR